MWGMNTGLLKSIISTLNTVQMGRSRGTYIINAVSFISVLFSMVSFFLDAATLAKVQVTSNPTSPLLDQLIAPQQLEE